MNKNKPKIFITRNLPERGLKLLFQNFGEENIKIYPCETPIPYEELLKEVRGIDALLCLLTDKIDAKVMEQAGSQLKIIANYAVGFDNIDIVEATKRKIVVTNTPGVLTETTADLAWALLMASARRLGEGERLVRASQWAGWNPTLLLGMDVHGKTLGIFGMGRIGQAVARRASGFNMRIIYYDVNEPKLPSDIKATQVDKETLLRESDFISIHCPLTRATYHAFGIEEFKKMKRTACIINTSRGPVIDEEALAQALKEGLIFSAGLDVFEKEPEIHPDLLNCPNAILIPHLGSASVETRSRMAEIAAQNIIARLNGKTPPNPVNPEVL
ncbi:MAG TPA: D-glycerate dehydrogenase [Candidatus Hydrogenedens sp.]|nr:D-glycerate dehydrogenase [Candidatus Hydrogenedens sp.]HOL20376.1 D-glycerate dehydrogenase [Candidatus Hydrogenedens sp.]HPP58719.1 D-glycerate dehydrogenase [Candidatus Hydrogenedens sp.]